MRVLLIDDEPTIREVIRTGLQVIAGHEVLACASGEEALRHSAAFEPDLLLIDLMMPGLDGVASLAALRALPALSSVPVVFISATVDPVMLARARQAQPLAVLEKPLDVRSLGATIESLLAGASPRTGH